MKQLKQKKEWCVRAQSVHERTLQMLAMASMLSSVPVVEAFVQHHHQSQSLAWANIPEIHDRRRSRGRRTIVSPYHLASVTTDDVFTSDASEEQSSELDDKLRSLSKLGRPPSLGNQGLSRFHQSILSRSADRQRLVTGKDPLLITVEDNPTRRWLGLGRDESAATSHLLVNGTTVERSTASFDRFQWIDDDEREELHKRYAMVSLELIAEVHIKKPGYVNVLPSSGAGSTAALRRVVDKSTAWNRYTGSSAILDEIDGSIMNKDRLWVSGFSLASQRGYLHSVDTDSGHIESANKRTRQTILWPNEFNTVPVIRDMRMKPPSEAVNSMQDDALLVSDGFLVPGKNKGGIYVVKNPGNPGIEWVSCLTGGSTKHHDWFYHRAVWVDLTGDGRRSIMTARAKSPSLIKNGQSVKRTGNQKGQLIWLEMPEPYSVDKETGTPLEEDGTLFDPFSARHTPWKDHVLDEGPDVMFAVADLDMEDDTIEVIASRFFDKKVSLCSIQRGPKPKVTFRRIIDDKCGSAFASILADLDCNGSVSIGNTARVVVDSGSTVDTVKPGDTFSHLLVTSHECSFKSDNSDGDGNATYDNVDGGSLFAYRVPFGKNAWKTEAWVRTTVVSGFRVKGQLGNMINPGAPGFCYTFHPTKDEANSVKRPLIAIAGDCAESAYIFRPVDGSEKAASSSDANANYKLMCEIECGATVGSIGIGYDDFCATDQQSGFAKLYIPCYEKDKVLVFAMGNGEAEIDPSGW